jgi:hypothetical protein
MNLRRFLFILFACCALGPPAIAQSQFVTGTITSNQCVQINSQGQATVYIHVGPTTWTGTLQPSVAVAGQTADNTTVVPTGDTASSAQSTITANGGYSTSVAAASVFQLCGNTVATGTATVTLQSSDKVNSLLFGGGGSGAGTVTSVGSGTGLTGGPITGSGTLALVSPVAVANGGSGTTSTLSGILRGGNPFTASELSGDCSTTGSNVTSCPPFARLAGATFTGEVITLAAASGTAGFNLPPGSAPSTPTNGDIWTTSAGLFAYINGSVVGPLVATGFANPLTTLGDVFVGGTSGTPTRLAGPTAVNGVPQQLISVPASGVATQVAWSPSGVAPRASTCTSNADTILATDREGYISWNDASACAVTLPAASSTGFATNFNTIGCDIGAGTATITPTTSTISYSTGTAYTGAASSMALTTGQCAVIYSDNTNYFAIRFPGAGSATTPINNVVSATGAIATIADGNNPLQITSAQTTNSQTAVAFNEASAATGTTDTQVGITTLSGSTSIPLSVTQGSNTGSNAIAALNIASTWNNALTTNKGIVFTVTDTAGTGNLLTLNAGTSGGTTELNVSQLGVLSLGAAPTVTTPGSGAYWFGTDGTEPASIGSGTSGFNADSTSNCPVQWNNAVNVGCSAALGAAQTFTATQTFAAIAPSSIALSGTAPAVTTSGTTPYLNMNTLVNSALSTCHIATAITLTSQTTICSWTLPGTSAVWSYQCLGSYTTSTTSISLTLGNIFAHAPSTGYADAIIWDIAAGTTLSSGGATNTGTTATTILAGSAVAAATSNLPWQVSGTFTGSATSGTFIIYGTPSTSGDITIRGTCTLQ